MLCRIGFPFMSDQINHVMWDEEREGFSMNCKGSFSLFANEAMASRFFHRGNSNDQVEGVLIETSSTGINGQSGGPLVDQEGVLCGIHSHTRHYPLGSNTKPKQFLNLGCAVHADAIRNFLLEAKVPHYTE